MALPLLKQLLGRDREAPGAPGNPALVLDREEHKNAIKNKVNQLMRVDDRLPPILVVVPGSTLDGHDLFVDRLVRYDAPKKEIFPQSVSVESVSLDWPKSTGDDIGKIILENAEQQIGLSLSSYCKTGRITKWLSEQRGQSIFIRMRICPDSWCSDGDRVRKWVEFVATGKCPLPARGRYLIVFLLVRYHVNGVGEQKVVEDKLRKYIADLKGKSSNNDCNILVLDELPQITSNHVGSWVNNISRKFPQLSSCMDRLALVEGRIFPHNITVRSKYFEDVYKELVRYLNDPSEVLSTPRSN